MNLKLNLRKFFNLTIQSFALSTTKIQQLKSEDTGTIQGQQQSISCNLWGNFENKQAKQSEKQLKTDF